MPYTPRSHLPLLLLFSLLIFLLLFSAPLPAHANSLTLPLSTAQLRPRRRPPCGQFCLFRLCNFNGGPNSFPLPLSSFIRVNHRNTASLPYICLPGVSVGRITRTREAQIFFRGNFTRISQWRPRGLPTPFRRNALSTFPIPFTNWSGIGTPGVPPEQWRFLDRRCFIMPIREYQLLNSTSGAPLRRVRPGSGRRNCVAFRSTAPFVQVQAIWDSADDFDLEVEEPDGDIVDLLLPRSESGRLNGDNNRDSCNTRLTFGRENIVYGFANIQSGRYIVRFYHYKNCNGQNTNWRLRILRNGALVRNIVGASNNDTGTDLNGRLLLETTFFYP
eukprot:GFKZ01005863.1.p1 GENE.GFKZ01005863.1~~GFKZ01005863.1.p1  ORF type:complete len:331 (+),score=22.02 GFKZ01005863.1:225-1217(+)